MAATPFWITGLPRSRTAWFALAMRGQRSTCVHELTAEVSSFEDLKASWLSGDPHIHRGNSDSACGLHIDRILAEIQPKTLIVERPLGEVLASLETLLGASMGAVRPVLEALEDALRINHPLVKRVRLQDLEDRDALIEAAEWLVPGHGEAAASVAHMNVSVTGDYARSLSRMPHSFWHLREAA